MLAEQYGLRPFSLSPFGDQTFYFDLVLSVGEHVERVALPEDASESGLKKEIVAALKRAGPGSLKTIGLALGAEEPDPGFGGMPPMGGGPGFTSLRQVLEQTYRVESVDLDRALVPGSIDVLLVAGPKNLGAAAQFAIDQYLMRGGSVLVLGGAFSLGPNPFDGIAVAKGETGLEELLTHWGVEVEEEVVLDRQAGSFPIPVTRDLGGFTVREIQTLLYPAFVDIRGDGMDQANPALGGLPSLVMHWASPVKLTESGGAEKPQSWTLLHSSKESWTLQDYEAQPDFGRFPELGWSAEGSKGERGLAVARMGPFESFWKGKAPPPPAPGEGGDPAEARRNVIEKSPAQARLVVVGSSAFVADPIVELTRTISDSYLSNLQFVQNLADWSVEDVELLSIRSRGAYSRTLIPTDEPVRTFLEWSNYALALVAVAVLAWVSLGRRGKARPMELDPRPTPASPKEAA
jgi:ABC-2 type transport system permease protein